MKLLLFISFALATFAGSVNAAPKDAQLKIAEIDYNIIYNAIGSERLAMLDVNPEIKSEIRKIKEQQERLLIEVIKENDDVKLASLQGAQQSLQNKLRTIYNILSQHRGSSDYRYQIRKYVSANYTDEFPIIMDINMRSNSSEQITISPIIGTHDITKRVIEDMEKSLP